MNVKHKLSQPIMAVRDDYGKKRFNYRNCLPCKVSAVRVMRKRNGKVEQVR